MFSACKLFQLCQRALQAAKKRPFPDSPSPSPSNHPSLSQRIRKDIQIGESEVESPEKEILRCQPIPENSPAYFSPCLKEIPSPVPLAPEKLSCVNCDADMNLDHQCEVIESDSSCEDVQCGEISSPKETDGRETLVPSETCGIVSVPPTSKNCEMSCMFLSGS